MTALANHNPIRVLLDRLQEVTDTREQHIRLEDIAVLLLVRIEEFENAMVLRILFIEPLRDVLKHNNVRFREGEVLDVLKKGSFP
jgi:hypothetical protein